MAGGGAMANLLSARDLQLMLRVDRSTIYRMAEDGTLPGIKVGRQWRFPEDRVRRWLGDRDPEAARGETAAPAALLGTVAAAAPLRALLPTGVLQSVCDLTAAAVGAMAIVTDLSGAPLTDVSNPCGLFEVVRAVPAATQRCTSEWRAYGTDPVLEARFAPSETFGFLCAHSFIRLDHHLVGMMLIGGIAPADWPPSPARIERLAEGLGVSAVALGDRIDDVHRLDDAARRRALLALPQACGLVSRLAVAQRDLAGRFDAIADLVGNGPAEAVDQRRYGS
jgi:excisionase family DNA binding protein